MIKALFGSGLGLWSAGALSAVHEHVSAWPYKHLLLRTEPTGLFPECLNVSLRGASEGASVMVPVHLATPTSYKIYGGVSLLVVGGLGHKLLTLSGK